MPTPVGSLFVYCSWIQPAPAGPHDSQLPECISLVPFAGGGVFGMLLTLWEPDWVTTQGVKARKESFSTSAGVGVAIEESHQWFHWTGILEGLFPWVVWSQGGYGNGNLRPTRSVSFFSTRLGRHDHCSIGCNEWSTILSYIGSSALNVHRRFGSPFAEKVKNSRRLGLPEITEPGPTLQIFAPLSSFSTLSGRRSSSRKHITEIFHETSKRLKLGDDEIGLSKIMCWSKRLRAWGSLFGPGCPLVSHPGALRSCYRRPNQAQALSKAPTIQLKESKRLAIYMGKDEEVTYAWRTLKSSPAHWSRPSAA
ncbi:hypothetical protein FA13DRAFT_1720701, partial [Coprinellus micaceus]